MDYHNKNKEGQETQNMQNTVSDWDQPIERPAPDARQSVSEQPVSEIWERADEAFENGDEALKTKEPLKTEETLKVEEAMQFETEDNLQ